MTLFSCVVGQGFKKNVLTLHTMNLKAKLKSKVFHTVGEVADAMERDAMS